MKTKCVYFDDLADSKDAPMLLAYFGKGNTGYGVAMSIKDGELTTYHTDEKSKDTIIEMAREQTTTYLKLSGHHVKYVKDLPESDQYFLFMNTETGCLEVITKEQIEILGHS